ncbi:MAG: hypothetical protein LH473_03835 [Chitinophagales bacterium]|nr:hypothetical protein [Chitinophagales bacterium]
MKKLALQSFLIVATMSLLFACTSNQTADQCLNDDHQRKKIFASITHHQPYMNEVMQEMMSNDSCKQMMMESMMSNPGMMNMTMNNMMSMCEKDSMQCMKMIGMMKEKLNVMKCCMKEMQGMSGM